MAYTAITAEQIAAGEPTSQTLFNKVKTNLEDHEDRILAVEGAVGKLPPIDLSVLGLLSAPIAMTGAITYRIDRATRLTACRALVVLAGTSGTLEVDVEYKRGGGAWTSIMSGPIQVGYATGNYHTQAGTLTFFDLIPGDLVRLNINAVQNLMQDFAVYLEREAA